MSDRSYANFALKFTHPLVERAIAGRLQAARACIDAAMDALDGTTMFNTGDEIARRRVVAKLDALDVASSRLRARLESMRALSLELTACVSCGFELPLSATSRRCPRCCEESGVHDEPRRHRRPRN